MLHKSSCRSGACDDGCVAERGRRRTYGSEHPVASGTAGLQRDPDRPRATTLTLDGIPQSHVDLADPGWLAFEYVRRLGHVVDLVAPPGQRLDVVHLGGGALTLPRYVATTRPGSRQRVFEIDAQLVELVRRELPLPPRSGIRVGIRDARAALGDLPDASADLVLGDVFAAGRTPAHLGSAEFAVDVRRVLRPGGCYALNVADGPPLDHARVAVATLASVFPAVALVADPAVLRGRRFGNLVLLASSVALPVEGLSRATAGDPAPGRLLDGRALTAFVAGAAAATDATALPSPLPPSGLG